MASALQIIIAFGNAIVTISIIGAALKISLAGIPHQVLRLISTAPASLIKTDLSLPLPAVSVMRAECAVTWSAFIPALLAGGKAVENVAPMQRICYQASPGRFAIIFDNAGVVCGSGF